MHEAFIMVKIVVKRNSDITSIDKIILKYLKEYHLEYRKYDNNNKKTIFIVKINCRDHEILYKICYEIRNMCYEIFNEFQEGISITFTFNSEDEDNYNSDNFIGDTEDSRELNKLHFISFPSSKVNKVIRNIVNVFKKYLILESATAVIITDRYILCMPKEDINILINFFSELKKEVTKKLKDIFFIIPERKDCITFENAVKAFEEAGFNLRIIKSNGFHDRFWLFCDDSGSKDGLVMGTSLNGLMSNYTIITRMEKEDIITLFNVIFSFSPTLKNTICQCQRSP